MLFRGFALGVRTDTSEKIVMHVNYEWGLVGRLTESRTTLMNEQMQHQLVIATENAR